MATAGDGGLGFFGSYPDVMGYWAVLLAFYILEKHKAFPLDWIDAGKTHALSICQGEWWRAVTAVAGPNRETDTTFGRAGRVRRLYVLPEHRNAGLARSLLEAIRAFGSEHYTVLTVNVGTLAARGFYERLRFMAVDHPRITHILDLSGAKASYEPV